MARAIAGGLIRSGYDPAHILIAEPLATQRKLLAQEFSTIWHYVRKPVEA